MKDIVKDGLKHPQFDNKVNLINGVMFRYTNGVAKTKGKHFYNV